MIAAFDVHYANSSWATAAAIVFERFEDSEPLRSYVRSLQATEDYIPGQFFRRELPCILAVHDDIAEPIDTVIVDGYAHFDGRPGLGAHLRESLGAVVVIGVAKSIFVGAQAEAVCRGISSRPLYVTSIGLDPAAAAAKIKSMHGEHRIPTLLKEADRLSRRSQGRQGELLRS